MSDRKQQIRRRVINLGFAIALGAAGEAVLWYYFGWPAALGAFLCIWGNNISQP